MRFPRMLLTNLQLKKLSGVTKIYIMNTKNLNTKRENLLNSLEDIKNTYGEESNVLVGMVSELFTEWSLAIETLAEIDDVIYEHKQKSENAIDENTINFLNSITKKIDHAPGNVYAGFKADKWFRLSLIEDLVKQATSLCGYFSINEKIDLESFTKKD